MIKDNQIEQKTKKINIKIYILFNKTKKIFLYKFYKKIYKNKQKHTQEKPKNYKINQQQIKKKKQKIKK
ncbi:hypothetical protein ACQWB2_24560 [Salmonella enterica subsp. enterica serovar Infantis]